MSLLLHFFYVSCKIELYIKNFIGDLISFFFNIWAVNGIMFSILCYTIAEEGEEPEITETYLMYIITLVGCAGH